MAREVIDASALLALVQQEPGAERVRDSIRGGAAISAVNFAEVIARLAGVGMPRDEAVQAAALAELDILSVDEDIAVTAGIIHAEWRRRSLSLADAVCIATARAAGAVTLTADRLWGELDLGVEVELIR